MQRLKSIWTASPFSWQGLRARWRYLAMAGALLLILLGTVYALRFRAPPGAKEQDAFATLAAEQQGRLNVMEMATGFERLKHLMENHDMTAATRLYNSLTLRLESSVSTDDWTELEPHLDELSAHLGRNDPAASASIDTIIALLR